MESLNASYHRFWGVWALLAFGAPQFDRAGRIQQMNSIHLLYPAGSDWNFMLYLPVTGTPVTVSEFCSERSRSCALPRGI